MMRSYWYITRAGNNFHLRRGCGVDGGGMHEHQTQNIITAHREKCVFVCAFVCVYHVRTHRQTMRMASRIHSVFFVLACFHARCKYTHINICFSGVPRIFGYGKIYTENAECPLTSNYSISLNHLFVLEHDIFQSNNQSSMLII